MIYSYKNQCTTFYNYLWKLHKSCAELRKVSDLNGEKTAYERKESLHLVKEQKLPRENLYVFGHCRCVKSYVE